MRQFFIIGHNPNTVADAINYLTAGANALEPDVHFTNGVYYMGEGTTSTDLSLTDYLQKLSLALNVNPALTPALIMFDTKNSNGNIPDLLNCIQTNFSAQFKDTAILITRNHATEEEHIFFAPAAGSLSPNKALGIDEHNEPEFADSFFKSLNVSSYTYADGISIKVPLLADLFIGRIKRAVKMRDAGNSFKMVYAWTLDSPDEIKAFLNLNPDGLITDSPAALKGIITNQFANQLQVASLGYNPFK
ncbi:MAG: glycerophosphodiester phosphodiesterase [Bacteroidia bacterium]